MPSNPATALRERLIQAQADADRRAKDAALQVQAPVAISRQRSAPPAG